MTPFQTSGTFKDIIAQSDAIKNVIHICELVAPTKETILLTGESGTGKDLFAQAIHNAYAPQKPFVAINCAAIPAELIESELFGYESGSFTGASSKGHTGKFELANGGTLFLDEIGEIPYRLQAVLLRVLEDKTITRVGGTVPQKVDFRLIAATNANLEEKIAHHEFREDLFYRISVIPVVLPALRDRENDFDLLFQTFLNRYCAKNQLPVPQILDETMAILRGYSWPGNIRQLYNSIITIINASREDGIISPKHIPKNIYHSAAVDQLSTKQMPLTSLSEEDKFNLSEIEEEAIRRALAYTNGVRKKAMDLLGISEPTLYRKIKLYNIK